MVGGMVIFEWLGDEVVCDIDVDGFCTFNDFDIVRVDWFFCGDFSTFVSIAAWHWLTGAVIVGDADGMVVVFIVGADVAVALVSTTVATAVAATVVDKLDGLTSIFTIGSFSLQLPRIPIILSVKMNTRAHRKKK